MGSNLGQPLEKCLGVVRLKIRTSKSYVSSLSFVPYEVEDNSNYILPMGLHFSDVLSFSSSSFTGAHWKNSQLSGRILRIEELYVHQVHTSFHFLQMRRFFHFLIYFVTNSRSQLFQCSQNDTRKISLVYLAITDVYHCYGKVRLFIPTSFVTTPYKINKTQQLKMKG